MAIPTKGFEDGIACEFKSICCEALPTRELFYDFSNGYEGNCPTCGERGTFNHFMDSPDSVHLDPYSGKFYTHICTSHLLSNGEILPLE